MAKQKNSNKGWIVGTVLGALGGAAYALWKTPMSGQQVRSKLMPGSAGSTTTASGSGVTGKFMDKVEHTLAPIVGVKLGQTANKTGDAEAVQVSQTTVYTADSAAGRSTTVKSDPESINEKRWAWGSPAPDRSEADHDHHERNDVDDPKFRAAETAQVEPNQPEAAPDDDGGISGESSSNATSAFGNDTIRQRRFGWGDPAPETTTAPPATEFNNVPSANSVMPEQARGGATATTPGGDGMVNTTGTADINPERTATGSSLTTPSPEQRVVPTSATDAVGSGGTAGSSVAGNADDTVLISAAGNSTGEMHKFPSLGGLED